MARSNKYDPASYSNQGFYGSSSPSNGAYGYANLAGGGGYGNLAGSGYGAGYGNYTDPTIYYGTSGSNIVHTNTFDPSITQILALGGNDTIYLYSSAPLSQFSNIDGGTGTDILSFINYSAGLTSFNPFSSSIKGIEQFVGTNYNDSIILTSGLITTFDGAGGNDTLNFSSFASAINFTLGVTTTYGTFTNFDSAIGTNYGDTVIGTSGDNVIDGGTGDDFITGNGGNDTIYGGANNNTIYTGSGNDTIYGGSLGDNIFLGGGNDTIDGGAGGGTNQLHFVSALGLDGITKNGVNISISAANGVSGTATYATGSVVTFRNFVNPVIFGTDAADVFTDDAGVITQFYGNEGNDIFYALGGNDFFYAGIDADTASFIRLGSGVTLNLSGSSSGTSGNFSYSGNIVYGSSTLYANGIEALEATNFNDTIQLNRTGVIGSIYGGAGYDTVTFAGATNGITFNEGAYYYGIEALIGSGFNDVINVNDVNSDVNGGAGTDTVTYANTSSGVTITASRYTSIENIIASGFNDRLVLNGLPSFTLDGGAGNDILDFSSASASVDVTVSSYNNFESLVGSVQNDTIRLNASQTNFIVDGGAGTNDIVTFANAASGLTINLNNYTNVESLVASGNNDIVQATTLPSFAIDGGAGNDTLSFASAVAGLDINAASYSNFENLTGSGFNDTIRLNGAQTGLIVNGGAGANDTVTFASAIGGVTINLNNYTNVESLIASGNNDIVQATSVPSFALDGGAGNDTLDFSGSSAGLTINASLYNGFENLTGTGGNDIIQLDAGQVGLIVNGGAGANDTVTFASAAGGVTINLNNYTNVESLIASGNNDTVQATSVPSFVLDGGAGNDTLDFSGSSAGLTINASLYNGFENLTGTGGNDIIQLGAGQVGLIVNGGAGANDVVTFASATGGVMINLNNYTNIESLIASGNNDIVQTTTLPSFALDGGAGNDTLSFASASTALDINAALYSNFENIIASSINDTIRLNSSQTGLTVDGGAGSNDIVTFASAVSGVAINGSNYSNVERLIASANNDTISLSNGQAGLIIDSGAGTNDVVTFASATSGVAINLNNYTNVESLVASGNNDIVQTTTLPSFALDGGAGNDTLSFASAATGLDINADLYSNFENLVASNNNDTIRLGASQTGLVVDGGAGTNDIVTFASALSGVTINANNYLNVETLVGSVLSDVINLSSTGNWTVNAGNGTDIISFASATAGITLDGSKYSGIEQFIGTGYGDTLNLFAGQFGNINGGSGFDIVNFFQSSSAVDVYADNYISIESIIGTSNGDRFYISNIGDVQLDAGGGRDLLSFYYAGSGVTANLGSDQIKGFESFYGSIFTDHFSISREGVYSVNGALGADTLDASKASGATFLFLDGIYDILGSSFNDVIYVNNGNKTDGGVGDDEIYSTRGDNPEGPSYSNDDIKGGMGNDKIFAGGGEDNIDGGADNDLIYGENGDDTILGGAGDDHIAGGSDTNFLYGGDGNDLIEAGDGIDAIDGGVGFDTYSYGYSGYFGVNVAIDGLFSFLTSIERIEGSNGADILRLDVANLGSLILDGGVGVDILDLSAATIGKTIDLNNLVSVESVIGSGQNDRFIASSIAQITGVDGGAGTDALDLSSASTSQTVNLNNLVNIEAVIGSGQNDRFIASSIAQITGVDGGAGTDALDLSSASTSQTVDLNNLVSIESVIGSGQNDRFIANSITQADGIDGGAGTDTLDLSNAATGQTIDLNNLVSIEAVLGSGQNDRFVASSFAQASGVDGGAGTDTLDLSGATSGQTVNLNNLNSIEAVLGSGQNDRFIANSIAQADGIDGGEGTDTLDLSNAATGQTIDLNNLVSIEAVLGSGQNDRFVASSIAQITGVDGGAGTDTLDLSSATNGQTVNLNILNSIESVIGSGQNDRFVASSIAQASGVDGGAGTDTLDLSSASTGQTINLNNLVSIEAVIGSGQNDRFIASSITQAAGIDGSAGTDTLDLSNASTGQTIDLNNLVSIEAVLGSGQNDRFIASSITQAAGIDGGAGTDTLDLSGATNGQTVNLNNLNSIEAVIGSGQNDRFIATSITQAAGIDGSAGTDTLDLSNASTGQTVNLNNLNSIEAVLGSGQNDRFIASSITQAAGIDGSGGTDTLDLSGATSGQTVNLNNLVSIEAVIGSGQNDRFVANSIEQITGVDGGAGTDTLDLSNASTGQTVNLNNLVSIEAVIGSGQNDQFNASSIGQIAGIDGGAGTDTLDLSSATNGQTVNLHILNSIEAVIGSGQNDRFVANSIEQITGVDGGAGTDTLDLSGATSGQTVNLNNLVSIEAVIGSGQNDRFVASSIAQITGVDGGAGTDTLDLSSATNGQTVNLNILNSIESVIGSGQNDRFVASSIAQAAGIDGGAGTDTLDLSGATNGQTIDISKLIRIENVIGSTKDDNFVFSDNIGVGIDARDGYDTVNYSRSSTSITLDLTDGKITGIEHIIATSGDDTIYLRPVDDGSVTTIEGGEGLNDTVSFEHYTDGGVVVNLSGNTINAAYAFVGVENFYGSEQEDIFIFSASGVLPADIHIDGKGGIDYLSFEELPLSASRPNPRNPNAPLPPLPVSIDVGSVFNQFNDFEGIIGSANNDNFILKEGASAMLDGGGGSLNSISFINFTHALDLTLSEDITVGGAHYHLANILGVAGSNLADIIRGDGQDNFILGNGGIDMLYGSGGKDIIGGGAGNDILYGEAGDDFLLGNAQHDTLYGDMDAASVSGNGDSGKDFLGGGTGNDTLYGGYGEDYLRGNSGRDTLYGGIDNDRVEGGNGDDVLFGGLDNDTLDGGGQSDILFGEDGDDILIDNVGVNQLTGGAGRDTFVLGSAAAKNTIMDFEIGSLGDILRVGDLLTRGTNFTAGGDFNAALQQYFRVSETSGNLELFIDQAHIGAFGPSGSLHVGWNQVAAFNGVNINLDNLINNGQIVFA